MGRSTKEQIKWNFKNLDSGEVLNPPYPMEDNGVRFSIGGVLAEQPRFGFQDPITQWVQGKTRVMSFQSVLWSSDDSDQIVGEFAKFERLAVKDEALGRPPIVVFTLGSWLQETVFVEAFDPDIPNFRRDGEPRQVVMNFNLVRYKPFSQTQIDPTKPKKESYFLVVSSAENSYERIARRFYGDPLVGDRLRKRNPAEPLQPGVGTKISIPARAIINKEEVEPEFHALSLTNQESVDAFNTVLERRSARKVVLT